METAGIAGTHDRPCGLGAVLLVCVVLWTDTFPVAAPQRATWQEVKVEFCDDTWIGPRVDVSIRVLWDVETPEGTERVVIADWKMIKWEKVTVKPPEVTP